MELLYVWIARYKNIVKQGFNLSSEYSISFDVTEEGRVDTTVGELHIKPLDREVKDFFGANVHLTAVVGENGAGKSNLFRFLLEFGATGHSAEPPPAIVVWKDEQKEKLQIYYTRGQHLEPNAASIEIVNFDEGKFEYPDSLGSLKDSSLWINYSNFFSPFQEFDYLSREVQGQINLTTNYLLLNDIGDPTSGNKTQPYQTLVNAHVGKERTREVKTIYYLKSKKNENVSLPFKTPQFLFLVMYFNENQIDSHLNLKKVTGLKFKEHSHTLKNIETTIWRVILLNFLSNFYNYSHLLPVGLSSILEEVLERNLFGDRELDCQNIKSFFDDLRNKHDIWKELVASVEKLADRYLIPYWDQGKQDNHSLMMKYSYPSDKFDKLTFELDIRKYSEDDLIDLIDLYFKTFEFDGYFRFFWRHADLDDFGLGNKRQTTLTQFSSGEQTQLSLMSRLHFALIERANNPSIEKRDISYNNKQHYFILIDEGELTLHPEWQRQFVNRLVSILNILIEGKEKTIQIILTTHSPLILSDIPKENVIFLKKDKETGLCKVDKKGTEKHTFGANLYDILGDAFFLDEGFIGTYAQEKIKEVIAWLNDENADMNRSDWARKVIVKVGEPVVQARLLEIHEEKLEKHDF